MLLSREGGRWRDDIGQEGRGGVARRGLGRGGGWASDLAREAAPDPKGDKATAGFRSGPGSRARSLSRFQ